MIPEGKYYASVFTVDDDELIAAVGTYFNQSNREYEFTISVNNIDDKCLNQYYINHISYEKKSEVIKLFTRIKLTRQNIFYITNKYFNYYAHERN